MINDVGAFVFRINPGEVNGSSGEASGNGTGGQVNQNDRVVLLQGDSGNISGADVHQLRLWVGGFRQPGQTS